MYYRFILKSSEIINSGGVLKSKYATAGIHWQATEKTVVVYSVYDGVTHRVNFFKTAFEAATAWHNINMLEICA